MDFNDLYALLAETCTGLCVESTPREQEHALAALATLRKAVGKLKHKTVRRAVLELAEDEDDAISPGA